MKGIDFWQEEKREELRKLEILSKWYELRKRGIGRKLIHLPKTVNSREMFFVFDDVDPWNTREEITIDQIGEMNASQDVSSTVSEKTTWSAGKQVRKESCSEVGRRNDDSKQRDYKAS